MKGKGKVEEMNGGRYEWRKKRLNAEMRRRDVTTTNGGRNKWRKKNMEKEMNGRRNEWR